MEAILGLDLAILDFIRNNITNPVLDVFMKIVTGSGEFGIIWIAAIILCLAFRKTRKAGVAMAVAMVIGLIICNATLKPLVARPRPFTFREGLELLIAAPTDFSFPSGHTVSSFAAATGLFIYHRRLGIVALVWALLMAFSRLYMYVHYPTDVIAGMLLGILCAVMAALLVNRFYQPVTDRITAVIKRRKNN